MRKSMKKFLCLILSLLMVTGIALSAVAVEEQPKLTVASVSGAAGYNVTVGISIDKNPNLGAIKFEIDYDEDELEFV